MKTRAKTMNISPPSSPSSFPLKSNPSATPFAELTNNLIPFSSLRNLCNSTNSPPDSNQRANFPLAKQHNNIVNSKPFTSNNVPSDTSPIAGKENRFSSSKFNSSIGSSSFNPVGDKVVVDPSSSFRAELTTPSRPVAPPPTPPLGEAGSGEHSYNRRQSDGKAKNTIYGLSASLLMEKDREEAMRTPSCCPTTLESILDKNLRTAVPSSHLRSSLPPKNKDKGKEINVTPIQPGPLKTSKDKGKAIALSPIRPAPMKTVKNKGIVFVTPSDEPRSKDKAISSPFDKLKVKSIEIQKPSFTCGTCNLTRDNDELKASPGKSRHPIIVNDVNVKVKKTSAPCDELPSETRNKDALLTPLNLHSKKADHKLKSVAMPSDCQLPSKSNENLVKEVETFTCPPLPRTRSTRKRTTKDEESVLPKSWTDPHPKKPKRRVTKEADQLDFLPKDFVEKYRAYFKEVDEFELPEEEVSSDDLDED